MTQKQSGAYKEYLSTLNPVTKLMLFFMIIAGVVIIPLTDVLRLSITMLLLLFAGFYLSGKFKRILKSAVRFYPMVFFISIMTLFKTVETENPLINVWGLNIYKTSVMEFIGLNIKMVTMLIASMIFAFSTSIISLANSLKSVHFPEKIISIIFLANRFIVISGDEIRKLGKSFRSRHIVISKKDTFRYVKNLFITSFLKLFNRNERIYMALSSRGFKGHFTVNMGNTFSKDDLISVVVTFSCIILLINSGLL